MAILLDRKLGHERNQWRDDEPPRRPEITAPVPQRLLGLRKAAEFRRLTHAETVELASLERERNLATADLQRIEQRRALRRRVSDDERRRLAFQVIDDELYELRAAIKDCEDDDERMQLLRRKDIVFRKWERAHRALPELNFGLSIDDQLIALSSPAARKRLEFADAAAKFYRNRLSTLKNDDVLRGTTNEILEMEQMLSRSLDDRETARQAAIDED